MPDRRTVGFDLLAIADRARRITAKPWLHETNLTAYEALDELPIQDLEEDDVDPWKQAIKILHRAVRLLIGAAQVERSPVGDTASRLWTEAKGREVEIESRPLRFMLTSNLDDARA